MFLPPALAEEVTFSVASVCVSVKVVGQGHRVKVQVVLGVLYPIDSREVQHAGVFILLESHFCLNLRLNLGDPLEN